MVRTLVGKKPMRDMLRMEIPWESPAVVWETGPYSIVRCETQWDYGMEGYFLAHCIGTKDYVSFSEAHSIYSLRDPFGIPHATILCLKQGHFSPYGDSFDLGTNSSFYPEGKVGDKCVVLQVRGREDALAMVPYHRIVRDWFRENGGVILWDDESLDRAVQKHHDTDYDYHFRYLLDESVNLFDWAYHCERYRLAAEFDGTSLH